MISTSITPPGKNVEVLGEDGELFRLDDEYAENHRWDLVVPPAGKEEFTLDSDLVESLDTWVVRRLLEEQSMRLRRGFNDIVNAIKQDPNPYLKPWLTKEDVYQSRPVTRKTRNAVSNKKQPDVESIVDDSMADDHRAQLLPYLGNLVYSLQSRTVMSLLAMEGERFYEKLATIQDHPEYF